MDSFTMMAMVMAYGNAILQQLAMVKTRTTRTPGPSGNPRQAKQSRASRASVLANYCLDLGFDFQNCCSGCQLYHETIAPERRYMLKLLLAKRHKTHTSQKYQCSKPWETQLEDAQTSKIHMVEQQLQHLKIGRRSLFIERTVSNDNEEEDTGAANKASEEYDGDTPTSASSCSSSLSGEPEQDPVSTATKNQTAKKKPVYVELFSHTIRSQGVEYVVENVPKTHAVIPKAHLKRLQNKERKLNALEKQFKRKRFPDVSLSTKTTIAMALVSVPALALRAAQYFIPPVYRCRFST